MVHNLIRRLHLFASFFLAAFILMYFVTGFVMIFENTFEREDLHVEKKKEVISDPHPLSKDSLVQWSKQKFGVRGQHSVRFDDKEAVLNFWRPGTVAEVRVSYPVDSVYVTIRKGNTYATMHHFHRLHGYHGGINYYAWAFMNDLSALSMIMFAFSGLYLWYTTEREHLAGWIVMIVSTAFTALTIIYLMFLS